jgi:hypothetical protein
LEEKNSGSGLETEITAVGIRHADHMASNIPQMLILTSPTSGGRSVRIVRSAAEATEFRSLILYIYIHVIQLVYNRKVIF